MTFRIVLSVDADRRGIASEEQVAALRASLSRSGVELVRADQDPWPGTADGRRDLPVRLCATPRSWYEFADGLEVADLSALGACVEPLADREVGRLLLTCLPEELSAAVTRHLGPALDSAARVWLFGAGLVGRQTAALAASQGVTPLGFLDNDTRLQGSRLEGLPVRPPGDPDLRAAAVVVCVGRHHAEIRGQLEELGAGRVLGLSEFNFLLGAPKEPECGYLGVLRGDRFRYIGLMGRLADPASRRVLCAVLEHRLTFSDAPLRTACSSDQWFIPEVFRARPDAVFVDGGAYDGDTAAEFVRRNGGPGRALELFEPDARQAERARRRLSAMREVRMHAAALSDVAGAARFSATSGMDGAVTAEGSEAVDVLTVDGTAGTAVTYLKLDVEGAEGAALRGARRTLVASHPTLAIAAYHRAADLWRIPAWIDALDAGYSLFLRHHSELAFETVLYGRAS
ncbi:MAG: FkbM family methyltransferase [Thermoleophilia bacterium]